MDFVLQAINHPTYLEDLTGLTELMKSASSFQLDWDNEMDDDDCIEIQGVFFVKEVFNTICCNTLPIVQKPNAKATEVHLICHFHL